MHVTVRSSSGINSSESPVANVRCPFCRKEVVLENVGSDVDIADGTRRGWVAGRRMCPNPECRALLFLLYDRTANRVVELYPQETIDFDASSLPQDVLAAFEEAVKCHAASCYTAAAMMVRKTLEELCKDRKAEGNNLKERIASLRAQVVLPQDLLDGADDLRLLGNDAAHTEIQNFTRVGKEEVEVAIDFAKEILKAVYQYSNLRARLAALKAKNGS